MARVVLNNTVGLLNEAGERVYYGPGEADLPDAYAEALGLEPIKAAPSKAKKDDAKEDAKKE